MHACLHPDIEFSDIGFQLPATFNGGLGKPRRQVHAMWHMICAKGTQIMFRDAQADEVHGTAHWECHYEFQKEEDSTPYSVHNVIEAKFRFDDGLIREHHDSCDFERWA